MRAPLLVIGDALLDCDLDGEVARLAPDAPVPVVHDAHRRTRPGGAALAALLAARSGHPVTFVTALGEDPASAELRRLLEGEVDLVQLPLRGTLSRKTRVRGGGQSLLRLDEGEGRAAGPSRAAREAVARAGTILVSDYGRGTADVLRAPLTDAAGRGLLVWDPHPRGEAPVPGVRLVTPSLAEAARWAATEGGTDDALALAAGAARSLVREWGAASVCVTLGARGALLSHGEAPLFVPTPFTAPGDPCGAGDRFAAAAAALLSEGALTEEAVVGAVDAAARFVADGGAASVRAGADPSSSPGSSSPGGALPGDSPEDPFEVVARVRANGGRVVATGGCFDLLHAGHVALLEAARAAGDCLVVCLNSDASVRRGKGPGRPLVPARDRARLLAALGCVDAVLVFDEETPERVLRALRPDVWAKGADYTRDGLPEADLVESWGGQVVLVPYLAGHSTTALAHRAATRSPR
ncbi:D-glycero-beta-D-manno-heptose 1-phosphate adenylyltransferase [Streptomyces sp. NRRL F-5630]|uniref:D-glycero-beta-D-manno-heptose 1-phosphate adenylyltransferase n=1 Tax=Streptomyces sp. NRRL F-5630 TaxID=1463864 RepID=UPI003EB79055